MWGLYVGKRRAAQKLDSAILQGDAACSLVMLLRRCLRVCDTIGYLFFCVMFVSWLLSCFRSDTVVFDAGLYSAKLCSTRRFPVVSVG